MAQEEEEEEEEKGGGEEEMVVEEEFIASDNWRGRHSSPSLSQEPPAR